MKSLEQLEKEWDEAAHDLAIARQAYHKATDVRQQATERHREAKSAYMAAKDKNFGLEGDDD